MDFDPSEFLCVSMSEDQNAAYTAPGLAQSCIPSGPIMIEGGLEMEKQLEIPVPVFGTLDVSQGEEHMDVCVVNPNEEEMSQHFDSNIPLQVEITEPEDSGLDKKSPAEKHVSPHTKKLIPTPYEESKFRKDFFCGNYERVKLFRLHCTICDKHLGSAPWFTNRYMRTHKLFSVPVCRKCFEFYGDVNFPIEDGSEIYCCWCGEGGEVFCCSVCPKIVCKKCVQRNFGPSKVKEIDANDNWKCFVCNPMDVWPHRALFWGWQRLAREMRQNVASLSEEEKQAKLSLDSSHCCLKNNDDIPAISLPRKEIMSRVPICLIASTHKNAVLNQPDAPTRQNHFIGSTVRAVNANNNRLVSPTPSMSQNTHGILQNQSLLRANFRQITSGPHQTVSRLPPIRHSPYPPMTQIVSLPGPSISSTPHIIRTIPNGNVASTISNPFEIITLDDDSPPKSTFNLTSSNVTNQDITWLEKGVKDVKEAVSTINHLTVQFEANKNFYTNEDVTKATRFSDKLNHCIKIAICSLAKINQEILDGSKQALDTRVHTVVSNIVNNGVLTKTPPIIKNLSPQTIEKVPERTPSSSPIKTASQPETPDEDDIDFVNPALLCETVLQVANNKENNDGNTSRSSTPSKTPVSNNPGRRSYIKVTARKSFPNSIPQVVNLVDDNDCSDSFYCKKFNIRPCKVVLNRLKC